MTERVAGDQSCAAPSCGFSAIPKLGRLLSRKLRYWVRSPKPLLKESKNTLPASKGGSPLKARSKFSLLTIRYWVAPTVKSFLGCTFPADDAYRMALQEMGRKVGENLAAKGALERYSVDFIAVHQPAIRSTLAAQRHRNQPAQRRHDASVYGPKAADQRLPTACKDGKFYTKNGQAKYYRASDNLQKDAYRGLLPNDLMDIIMGEQLHFNSIDGVGVVFHLMGCLSEHGKLGPHLHRQYPLRSGRRFMNRW